MPRTPSSKPKSSSKRTAKEYINNWIKEFELVYNLSPKLNQSQIDKLLSIFRSIVNIEEEPQNGQPKKA